MLLHYMTTVLEEENPDDFIIYMFDSEPKPKDSIQLECPDKDYFLQVL